MKLYQYHARSIGRCLLLHAAVPARPPLALLLTPRVASRLPWLIFQEHVAADEHGHLTQRHLRRHPGRQVQGDSYSGPILTEFWPNSGPILA